MSIQANLSDAPMVRTYIGIGSNLDDPARQVVQAIAELDGILGCCCITASSLYSSKPLGPQDQPDYVNAVAAVDAALPAHVLLGELQRIEHRHERDRTGPRWGPRTLDLDLLLYGDAIISSETLTVPHPGVLERGFVLYPLFEIAPGLHVPGAGFIRDHVAEGDGAASGVRRLRDRPHA